MFIITLPPIHLLLWKRGNRVHWGSFSDATMCSVDLDGRDICTTDPVNWNWYLTFGNCFYCHSPKAPKYSPFSELFLNRSDPRELFRHFKSRPKNIPGPVHNCAVGIWGLHWSCSLRGLANSRQSPTIGQGNPLQVPWQHNDLGLERLSWRCSLVNPL